MNGHFYVELPSFIQTPDCNYEVNLSSSINGSSDEQPFVQLDVANNRFDIFSQEVSDAGTYVIILTATLSHQYWSPTGTEDKQNEWTLTLIDPCLSTEINSVELPGFVSLQNMASTVKSASIAEQFFAEV